MPIRDGWDGKERRSDNYHEILIRIDANLENAISTFIKHEQRDAESFGKVDNQFEKVINRVSKVEQICYGVGGVIVFVDIISKFMHL